MIFFTSDQHYGYKNVIKLCNRPFASLDEMHAELVKRHNAIVTNADVVIHLGDFSMNKKYVKEYLPQLKGNHYLIKGNHDACHPAHCKSYEKEIRISDLYLDYGFWKVQLMMNLSNTGYDCPDILLHHMPYAGGYENERYPEFRLKDEGHWLLHGHVHNAWKIKGKQINVGVDVWDFTPVPITEIRKIILDQYNSPS